MQSIFLNDVLILNWTIAEFIFYFFHSAALFTLLLCSVISFLYLRPKLPYRVNCWFCNRSFWVPYPDRNCFDCRYCDQYNGFTDDGDYNTDVLSRRKTQGAETKVTATEPDNGLCQSCNLNQQLKVQQLANFVPMSEDKFDEEIQHFQNQLDKCYKLCERCALVLTQTLQTQHYNLLEKRLNGKCPVGEPQTPKSVIIRYRVRKACYVGATSCLVFLTSLSVYDLVRGLGTVGEFLTVDVERFWFLGAIEISTIGAVFSLVETILHEKFATSNFLYFSSWGVVHCVSWISNPWILSSSSLIALVIHIWPKKVEMKKKVCVEKIRPVPTETIACAVKASIHKTINVDKEPVTEKVKPKKQVTPPKMETRSRVKKLTEQRAKLFSPPPEVYAGFSKLRLSSPVPEKQPVTPSIIKPAKLTLGKRTTPSPPLKPFSTPGEDLSICKFMPCNIDYDCGPCSSGFFSPVTHTAYSYSFHPAQVSFGFQNGRFSPPFGSQFDSSNSSRVSNGLNVSQEKYQVWDWMKRSFWVSSCVLNIVAMVFFLDEVRRRMFY